MPFDSEAEKAPLRRCWPSGLSKSPPLLECKTIDATSLVAVAEKYEEGRRDRMEAPIFSRAKRKLAYYAEPK